MNADLFDYPLQSHGFSLAPLQTPLAFHDLSILVPPQRRLLQRNRVFGFDQLEQRMMRLEFAPKDLQGPEKDQQKPGDGNQ